MSTTFDFKTFLSVVPYILKADAHHPIMIRGRHGVGKSQVVYQTAGKLYWDTNEQHLGYKNDDIYNTNDDRFVNYTIVERRASQMSEGDLLGIPKPEGVDINGETAMAFNAPDGLITACTEPCVLFMDELDRDLSGQIRQGFFEVADSRKLAGWHLHPGTVIFSACNGGIHGSQYQVAELDPAELSRWATFDIEPSVEDWLNWASDSDVDKVLWDFINMNRVHLEHNDDIEPNKVYPSRRSWARLDEVLQTSDLLGNNFDAGVLFALTTGYVGSEAAITFVDFVKSYDRQVSLEDILDNGEFDKLEEWGINEYAAFVDKMEAADVFAIELTDVRAKNVAEFFATYAPSEVSMKLWTALTNGRNDDSNVIKFYTQVVSDGRPVSTHLVEMCGGDNENQ